MRNYYLLRSDGSSVFSEGHCKDFIWHCYYQLLDRSEESFTVISFEPQLVQSLPLSLLACDGTLDFVVI